MPELMNIGEAADAVGVSTKMIRHYEQIGLMPAAARSDAGYRRYSERDVSVLRFIRQSRRLGFSIPQIAELIGLWSNQRRTSRQVKALAQRHVDDLEQKMREMAQMRDALRSLLASCHGDDDPHCAILDELALRSPAAPEPGSIEAAKLRRPAGRKAAPPAARTSRPDSGHADLMAWTHGVQRHGGH